ncbi:ferredoxin [Halosimplex halophilum]|uniref:ferredoxin n=1 Tax=Halosimplex halophilum TaxID=2559572 RepID=UPI00107F52F5|nr:ferredoxin [Halosimplex halophilum]
MTTEYRVSLDRAACDGVFACLVRDDRFVEAADGLAAIDGDAERADGLPDDGSSEVAPDGGETVAAPFDDDRIDAARQAAAACPVDAIEVTTVEEGATPADATTVEAADE